MTAAEKRNEIYKVQLAELGHHNASLLETIGKLSDEHGKEACGLKEQIDLAVNEAHQQREAFTSTISGTKKKLNVELCRKCK